MRRTTLSTTPRRQPAVDNRHQMTMGVSQCTLPVTPGKQALSSLYRQPSWQTPSWGDATWWAHQETTAWRQFHLDLDCSASVTSTRRQYVRHITPGTARRQQARHFIIAVPLHGHHSIFTRPEYSHSHGFHFTLSDRDPVWQINTSTRSAPTPSTRPFPHEPRSAVASLLSSITRQSFRFSCPSCHHGNQQHQMTAVADTLCVNLKLVSDSRCKKPHFLFVALFSITWSVDNGSIENTGQDEDGYRRQCTTEKRVLATVAMWRR